MQGVLILDIKSMIHEGKIDKLDFIRIKNICSPKAHVKRMKRQIIDLEKIFANYISNKKLVFITYKEPSKLNVKREIFIIFYNCM